MDNNSSEAQFPPFSYKTLINDVMSQPPKLNSALKLSSAVMCLNLFTAFCVVLAKLYYSFCRTYQWPVWGVWACGVRGACGVSGRVG